MKGARAVKKSFVLYFDAYPCLEWLPADQRGELFLRCIDRYTAAQYRYQ